ncbi:MAG: AbgT family transporter [Planctomycetaceae bacterium]|nr:AbgT family transporter [Planctomycetaceae bacterium]
MSESTPAKGKRGPLVAFLDTIEWMGNKLPDPAVLFVIGIVTVWVASAFCSPIAFTETLPGTTDPIRIVNLLSFDKLADFLSKMTETFVGFHPLGVVLVAMLGVGVADHSGFINAVLKTMLTYTPKSLLTPMVIFVAIISHTAADAGYVVVIPLAGVIFYGAGRHPLAGIAAAFAGVSGGFSANFIPCGIDPLLAGLTTTGARLIDGEYIVNPLCNLFFTGCSSILIIAVGWVITDFLIEPKLRTTAVDGDPAQMPKLPELSPQDRRGMMLALLSIAGCAGLLALWALWPGSSLQAKPPEGEDWALYQRLTSLNKTSPARLMNAIVPLIFIFFLIPGLIHGFVSGNFKTHRDAIKGMSKAMESMGYYLVLVFFAALFIASFTDSRFGALLAVKGAAALKSLNAPPTVTVLGVILLSTTVNLLIGSASAKWAMLAPIFVPMLMLLGISPELTQAAYRVGDSCTNIITPMMPYFPLVVVFCQRYVKNTGLGTVTSLMLPYSMTFLVVWSAFLFIYWQIGLPLGISGGYEYVMPTPAAQ